MGSSRQSMQAGQHQPDKRSGRMNEEQEQQAPTTNAVQADGTKQGRQQDRTHTHMQPRPRAPHYFTLLARRSAAAQVCVRCARVYNHTPRGGREVSIPPPPPHNARECSGENAFRRCCSSDEPQQIPYWQYKSDAHADKAWRPRGLRLPAQPRCHMQGKPNEDKFQAWPAARAEGPKLERKIYNLGTGRSTVRQRPEQ